MEHLRVTEHLLLAMMLLGCNPPPALDPSGWLLDSGISVSDLSAGDEPTALLIVDPAECLQCRSILAEWFSRRADRGARLLTLLARPPSELDHRILAIAGIRTDGTIVDGGPRMEDTPMELVLTNGRVLYSAYPLAGPSSPLLRELARRSLAEFAESPSVSALSDPQPQ